MNMTGVFRPDLSEPGEPHSTMSWHALGSNPMSP
jgi:hypothetical protein